MAGELVTAYIRLVPTVQGIQGATAAALAPAVGESAAIGATAGRSFGSAFGLSTKKLLLGAGGLLAGLGLAKFIHSSADAFKELNAETKGLQRTAGGTIPEVSKLRGALQLSGVTVPKATISLKIFSKQLGLASGDAKKAATMQKLLGTSFTDSKGQVENLTTLLPKVADKFKGMADGPNKAALALKLFGRSGIDMLPFLNKGADGIVALEAQAKKLGITLDDTSNAKWMRYREETRKADAATQGLKVTIGGALLPVFTSFEQFLTNQAIPAFGKVISFFKNNPAVQSFVDGLTTGFDKMSRAGDRLRDSLGKLDFSNLDSKKLGEALVGGIGHAISALGRLGKKVEQALSRMLKSVDWVGVGIKAGPLFLGFVVGISTGIINGLMSHAFWDPILAHKGQILLGLGTVLLGVFAAPEALLGKVATAFAKIPIVGRLLSGLLTSINAAGGKLFRGPVAAFFSLLGRAFVEGFRGLKIPGGGLLTKIGELFRGIGPAVERLGHTLTNKFGSLGIEIGTKLAGAIRGGISKIGSAVSSLGSSITKGARGFGNLLLTVGEDIARGLAKGIGNGFAWVKSKITELGGNIISWARSILHINSPSKVFIGIGGSIGEGLALGIAGSSTDVHGATRALVASAIPRTALSGFGAASIGAAASTGPHIPIVVNPSGNVDERAIARYTSDAVLFALGN